MDTRAEEEGRVGEESLDRSEKGVGMEVEGTSR
jgi:hypothetical protein